MLSIFLIFFVELILFRWGTSILRKANTSYGELVSLLLFIELYSFMTNKFADHHGHDLGAHAAHGPEGTLGHTDAEIRGGGENHEHTAAKLHPLAALDGSALAQITGIFVLEFGILLHSLLIGLTLAVDENFKVLFVVLVFHRTCYPSSCPQNLS